MSSTRIVPETGLMADEELSADDAWHTLRRQGGWHLLRDAFIGVAAWMPLPSGGGGNALSSGMGLRELLVKM